MQPVHCSELWPLWQCFAYHYWWPKPLFTLTLMKWTGFACQSHENIAYLFEDNIARSLMLLLTWQRHIYGHDGKNIQIFAESSYLAINPSYITSWLSLLSRTPRVSPFLLKTDPLIMALRKELAEHTAEVNIQHEGLDGLFTFYDSTKATLNIYQVASVTFDLLLLLVLGSYLIVLFSFLVITTRGVDDLISLFRRPPSRKVKTAWLLQS